MTDAALPSLAVPPGLALTQGEELRGVFRPDLDAGLRYAESVVALTSQRLCWQPAAGAWTSLDISSAVRLERREYAGLGELRIVDGERTVARFFHTLAVGKEATLLWDALPSRITSGMRPSSSGVSFVFLASGWVRKTKATNGSLR